MQLGRDSFMAVTCCHRPGHRWPLLSVLPVSLLNSGMSLGHAEGNGVFLSSPILSPMIYHIGARFKFHANRLRVGRIFGLEVRGQCDVVVRFVVEEDGGTHDKLRGAKWHLSKGRHIGRIKLKLQPSRVLTHFENRRNRTWISSLHGNPLTQPSRNWETSRVNWWMIRLHGHHLHLL